MGSSTIKKLVFGATASLLLSSNLNALTFQDYQKQQNQSYKKYEDNINAQFKAYKKAYNEAFKEFSKQLGKKWPDKKPDLTTKKKWVEYSKDLNSKKSIDYKKKEISLEVIANSEEEARK